MYKSFTKLNAYAFSPPKSYFNNNYIIALSRINFLVSKKKLHSLLSNIILDQKIIILYYPIFY